MKKFTVKDFIAYNNPCFSCGERISFKIGIIENTVDGMAHLRPTVAPEHTVVDLKITYNSSLQLWIFHKSNKIISSNNKELTTFLSKNNIFLHSRCDKCYTNVQSQFLEFNLDKGFIKPVGISEEMIIITDDNNMYHVNSSFIEERTSVVVDRLDKATPVSPIKFELPLLPMYKFKDKEHFLNKMKTYVLFS